jgi:hypothetical protein
MKCLLTWRDINSLTMPITLVAFPSKLENQLNVKFSQEPLKAGELSNVRDTVSMKTTFMYHPFNESYFPTRSYHFIGSTSTNLRFKGSADLVGLPFT